jgi:hypothetical protein
VTDAASSPPAAKRSVRRLALFALAALGAAILARVAYAYLSFPSDHTPEGAYLRVAIAVNRGRPEDFFAYTETRAQHAAYTIRDFRKKARERVLAAYPEPERSRLAEQYASEASAPDGADVFALYARRHGWITRLRRDMSGIKKVEISGDRAQFTPILDAEAERAARDFSIIERAAADYARAPAAPAPSVSASP